MTCRMLVVVALAVVWAGTVFAGPTRSSPIAVGADGAVFVVNPDSDSVARLVIGASSTRLEAAVGRYPRTLALAGGYVFVTAQGSDAVWRLDQADLGNTRSRDLGVGCAPYGVTATPNGDRVIVTCQGSRRVVILDPSLDVRATLALDWPNPRAIAVSSDGGRAYVAHFLTEEPGTDAHVTVVDVPNQAVATVWNIAADTTTCENQNAGQGILNLISTIALIPDGAPAEVAGQVWIGGTQQNVISKGLFERSSFFADKPGAAMFSFLYKPLLEGGGSRNIYKASFHDITRFGILKLDAASGQQVGKIDVDEANHATDLAFSPDGVAAYVVDQMFNSYHIFNTVRGQKREDVTTLFAGPSRFGEGGEEDDKPCVPDALTPVVSERPYRLQPQAQITTIDGYDPADTTGAKVLTGVEFDTVAYMTTTPPVSRMTRVADGIGTAPIGVAVSPDGRTVYVANYLARNVVPTAAALPLDPGGKPENLRCSNDISRRCGTSNHCVGGVGSCNHPGGAACTGDADCGNNGPCVQSQDCIPLMVGQPVPSTAACDPQNPVPPCDPVTPAILDGKILFNTAARDSSTPNGIGLGRAAPLYNQIDRVCANNGATMCTDHAECGVCANSPATPCHVSADCGGGRCVTKTRFCSNNRTKRCAADRDCPGGTCENANPSYCSNDYARTCAGDGDCAAGGTCGEATCSISTNLPGTVTSVSHDASYVTCTGCHADFGGQDGRTWDFAQFGASLRNTMDLRGRAGFAPGTCEGGPRAGQQCSFDADCHQCTLDNATTPPRMSCEEAYFCRANPAQVPSHITDPDDRKRWFNPMLTVHWNGDRDEVEDFEHTYRQLMGAGDCDGLEDKRDTCLGGLIQRSTYSSSDPADVDRDLGRPNRNIVGPKTGRIVGIRLTHMADFVYSLTAFPKNPNPPTDAAAERGRKLFNDPATQCANCHNGGPGPGRQFFSNKGPTAGFDPNRPAGADGNNPFVRNDVGTANVFDETDPDQIATANQSAQNPNIPIPGKRGRLGDYVTPVLNDLWNTAPYLHDGSAPTLLDVVRPCDDGVDDCNKPGRGRNIRNRHGVTDILTPQQLNDLVAFQNALTLGTIVGTNERVLTSGAMTLSRLMVKFGKPRRRSGAARAGGRDSFALRGRLTAQSAVDPVQGLVLSLATPAGPALEIFSRPVTLRGRGRRFGGRSTAGGGVVVVGLKQTGSGEFRLSVKGKKLDLTALNTERGDPRSRDLRVGVEIGQATFARGRNLVGKKRVFKLTRRD